MKWLYFTRSNGDIDNLNIEKYNKSRSRKLDKFPKRFHGDPSDEHGPNSVLIPLLDKAKNRRAFIGDNGSENFSIQDSVKFPTWDSNNKEYVVDTVLENQHIQRESELVDQRDILQNLVAVIKNLRSRIKALEA